MAWKPKEKELTPQEAIDLAKKELAPFWFGLPPQIAGVRVGDESIVVPLDSEFLKKSWLVFFIDLSLYSGAAAIGYANEWYDRYQNYELGILIVLVPSYSFLKLAESSQKFVEKYEFKFPCTIDAEGIISACFRVHTLPKILLLDQGKTVFEHEDKDWLNHTEFNIQKFLRLKDVGLPLLQVLQPLKGMIWDSESIEFGSNSNRKDIKMGGEWIQESERILTSDPNAWIEVNTRSSNISLIAGLVSKKESLSKVVVELDGVPVPGIFRDQSMFMEDTGQSVVQISIPQLYSVIMNLSSDSHQITFRCPHAKVHPIAFYGLRFGDVLVVPSLPLNPTSFRR